MSSQSLVNPLMANLSSQAYPAQFNEEMDQSFSLPLFTHVTVLSNSPLGIICPDITLDKVSLTLGTGSWLMLSKQGRRCLENISKGSDWSSSTARHIWTKLLKKIISHVKLFVEQSNHKHSTPTIFPFLINLHLSSHPFVAFGKLWHQFIQKIFC